MKVTMISIIDEDFGTIQKNLEKYCNHQDIRAVIIRILRKVLENSKDLFLGFQLRPPVIKIVKA